MRNKNYKPLKGNNFYPEGPVNQGFYKRNCVRAKKLYMDEYDRLKQQINKRREDREFNEMLSNYYNDFNELTKKHPFLHTDYNKSKESESIDLNYFELKKKNINALFFKYDNTEDDFNFDITDELINSMNKGDNKSMLNSFEIKEDYKKRLDHHKIKEIMSNNDKDNKLNDNNDNKYTAESNINLSIISENNRSKKDNRKIDTPVEKKEKNDNQNEIIIENYPPKNNIDETNNKQKNNELVNTKENIILKSVKEESENQLIRYKKYLKDNMYPLFEDILNPYKETNYIPLTYIFEEQKLENSIKDNNKISQYNDFLLGEEIIKEEEDENNSKTSKNNKIENSQIPMVDNIINKNSNFENQIPQYNNFINVPTNGKEEKKEDDYENEKFDEDIDNSINNINKNPEKKIGNFEGNNYNEKINQYPNGELKMMDNIIKENKYHLFEHIINPYYQTNYNPPEVFIQPKNEKQEQPFKNINQEINSQIKTPDLPVTKDLNEINNNKFPRIEVRIRSKNNPSIENIIKNDSDNQDIPINNEFEKKGEEDRFQKNDGDNENLSNKMKINDGNKFNSIEEMIKNNYQNNNNQGEIMEVNNDENEYNDFEVDEN